MNLKTYKIYITKNPNGNTNYRDQEIDSQNEFNKLNYDHQ